MVDLQSAPNTELPIGSKAAKNPTFLRVFPPPQRQGYCHALTGAHKQPWQVWCTVLLDISLRFCCYHTVHMHFLSPLALWLSPVNQSYHLLPN